MSSLAVENDFARLILESLPQKPTSIFFAKGPILNELAAPHWKVFFQKCSILLLKEPTAEPIFEFLKNHEIRHSIDIVVGIPNRFDSDEKSGDRKERLKEVMNLPTDQKDEARSNILGQSYGRTGGMAIECVEIPPIQETIAELEKLLSKNCKVKDSIGISPIFWNGPNFYCLAANKLLITNRLELLKYVAQKINQAEFNKSNINMPEFAIKNQNSSMWGIHHAWERHPNLPQHAKQAINAWNLGLDQDSLKDKDKDVIGFSMVISDQGVLIIDYLSPNSNGRNTFIKNIQKIVGITNIVINNQTKGVVTISINVPKLGAVQEQELYSWIIVQLGRNPWGYL